MAEISTPKYSSRGGSDDTVTEARSILISGLLASSPLNEINH